ncbi:hypothetical protein Barb7_01078 [Bacteroidales bacterium Barb7]|nr:hypothetical protein Barb7_01078 [Bacteroidales bacterium Barb7]
MYPLQLLILKVRCSFSSRKSISSRVTFTRMLLVLLITIGQMKLNKCEARSFPFGDSGLLLLFNVQCPMLVYKNNISSAIRRKGMVYLNETVKLVLMFLVSNSSISICLFSKAYTCIRYCL